MKVANDSMTQTNSDPKGHQKGLKLVDEKLEHELNLFAKTVDTKLQHIKISKSIGNAPPI